MKIRSLRRLAQALIASLAGLAGLALSSPAFAATSDAGLRMEVITAYNFVVDSNIESPAGKSPSAAHLGVKIYNDGPTTLTNVVVNIGNLTDPLTSTGTPGVFASRTPTPLETGGLYSGTFSLQMPGGATDAIRVIPSIAPGEYVAQYFFVTYPLKDNDGNSVAGAAPVVTDDLWLNYDIWASATDGLTTRRVDQRTKVTMRNEISAMANKIWPNGDNKVPQEYLDAIQATLGWRPQQFVPRIPGASMVEGIWYDLGNVGAGFDNNGDGIPDRNAWMQPVGDPSLFNPLAARMVKCYGLLIVKLNDGTEQLIPFEDKLYFENIAGNNTNVVGLVYYEFLPLNTSLPSQMTPYQEVASGYDNEKFNADYGRAVGAANNNTPDITFDKNGSATVTKPGTISYSLTATNISSGATTFFGWPDLGLPAVFQDSVPSGLGYVAGSATSSNITPPGETFTVTWSTDGGTTWSLVEPANGTLNVSIRWTLSGPLGTDSTPPDQNNTATVAFQATVPSNYTPLTVVNTGCIKTGTEINYACDTTTTRVLGINSIGDFVWRDLDRDGVQDGGLETGIANIGVSLYLDANNNGILDSGESLYATTTTNGSGAYLFSSLPDARYIAVVDSLDTDLPYGYTLKAGVSDRFAIDLDSAGVNGAAVNFLTADWPFIAGLEVTKAVAPTVYNEGDLITYDIHLDNHMSTLVLPTPNLYTLYATSTVFDKSNASDKANEAQAAGAPNNQFVRIDWNANSDRLVSTGVTPSFTLPGGASITKVELIVRGYQSTPLANDQLDIQIGHSDRTIALFQTRTTAQMNALVGVSQDLVIDISSASGVTPGWTAAEINSLSAALVANKTSAGDTGDYTVDSIGFRVTTNNTPFTGSAGPNTISVWPLKDTYDPAKLQYVTASVLPDVTTPAGTLEWFNLGPVNAGARKSITVTFRALAPTNTTGDAARDPMTANNYVTTVGVSSGDVPLFQSGLPAGHDDGTVDVTINPAGSIGDFVYWDINANNAYTVGTDLPLQGVIVQLFSGGVYTGRSQITDANGYYLFTGLANGTYEVRITTDTTSDLYTLPWIANPVTSTQRGTVATTTTSNTFVAGNTVTLNNTDTDTTNDNNYLQDFGFDSNTASIIAGTLFRDWDGDGIQDPGDEPLVGYTIRLTPPTGPTVDVLTDANGNYLFTNLTTAGNYTVTVIAPPASHTQTLDPDVTFNNATTVNVVLGNAYLDRDFAYRPTGALTIGDTLYYDWNGNATQQVGEDGIANVTVRLYQDENGDGVINLADSQVANTTTNASGFYQFTGLATGNYIVAVDTADPDFPSTSIQTQDYDGLLDDKAKVNLTVSLNTVDFGYKLTGTGVIGNYVWLDADNDGVQDPSEGGISGVTVELYLSTQTPGVSTPVATTTTTSGGAYSFTGLAAGNYVVYIPVSNFTGGGALVSYPWSSTTTNTGDNAIDTDDNGIQTTFGQAVTSPVIALASGETDNTKDFGFTAPGTVGDFVFYDNNGNGTQDYSELGIANVSLSLYLDADDNGVPDGAALATTTTADGSGADPTGFYRFTNVAPGNYIVRVNTGTLPAGLTFTADPDRDGIPVGSPPALPAGDQEDWSVLVTAGSSYSSADFGYQPPGAVGDFVWLDLNQDTVQDPGEPGLANVSIQITNGVTTYNLTTDFDGYWSQVLANGTWSVTVLASNFNPGGALENLAQTYDADGIGTANVTSITIVGGVVTVPAALPQGNLGIDFGYRLNGAYNLSGTVAINDALLAGTADDVDDFFDDGVDLDAGPNDELELSGVEVFLYTNGGDFLGSTYTDANGDYSFTGLPSGTYRVIIGTTAAPLDNATLTTTTGNNLNGFTVSSTLTSVTQFAVIAASDVQDVDFTFDSNVDYDYGDLPGSYGMTTLTQDGARHIIPAGGTTVFLGTAPDAELNGLPTANASGDDASGSDDENGVTATVNSWVNGANGGSVTVNVTGTGYLVGWIDWNNDGTFLDAGEFVINQAVTPGVTNISFTIPNGTIGVNSESWLSRFRLFTSAPPFPLFSYEGEALDGEVEDYIFEKSVGGSIGDIVWNDADGSATLNGSETGIAGRVIELRDGGNALIATQTTSDGTQDVDGDGVIDPVGYYRFRNVPAGTYTVTVTNPPAGYDPSYDENGIGTPHVTTVVLGTDVQHLTADFGYEPQVADLSGTVYFDTDNSLGFSGPDTPAPFVRIQLFTDPDGDGDPSDGVQVRETFTDASGYYIFTDVPSGDYVVVEVNPPGATSVTDVVPPNDDRIPVTMAGVDVTGRDFLDNTPPQYAISGTVYEDFNGTNDNVIGVDDIPVSNVTVQLYLDRDGDGLVTPGDTLLDTTLTDSNGDYSFTGLVPGNYVVQEIDPAGAVSEWDADAPLTDNQIGVTIVSSNVIDRDFLDDGAGTGVLGNLVWLDLDNDGIKDLAESGISGVSVQLYQAGDTPGVDAPFATTTTSGSGIYTFTNVPAGSFFVYIPASNFGSGAALETSPLSSTITNGADDSIDNDDNGAQTVAGAATFTSNITVSEGETDNTKDFGFVPDSSLGAITGTVRSDNNNDGVAPFVPLQNVTLTLLNGDGSPYLVGGNPVTTLTAADGTYSFTGLPPGNYRVAETQPTGYGSYSDKDGGTNLNLIGDVTLIAVTAGATNTDNDFLEFLQACPDLWVDWQTKWGANPLVGPGQTGTTQNPDGDRYDNLTEYAFCMPPHSGVNDAFCIAASLSVSGGIDGVFSRTAGAPNDVTYYLEYASVLGSPTTSWMAINLTGHPSVTITNDGLTGKETVRITDIETVTGLIGGQGFVRIRVDLDDGVTQDTSATEVHGWTESPMGDHCQTYNNPYVHCLVFTGTVDGVTGPTTIDLTDSAGPFNLATALANDLAARPGSSYYLEVTSGDNEGHRYDLNINAATATTVDIAPDSNIYSTVAPFNTLANLPTNLAGDTIEIRRHWTINELFPPSAWTAGNAPDQADQLQFWNGAGYTIYWLYDNSGSPKWVNDGTMADRGTTVIAPGQGMFVTCCQGTGNTTILAFGEVRENDFIRPLATSSNLVGGGYPFDQAADAPRSRAMSLSTDFYGNRNWKLADQFLRWKGDLTPGGTGWVTYFLFDGSTATPPRPEIQQWTIVGDLTITNRNASVQFLDDESVIIRANAALPAYTIPAPWAPGQPVLP